MAKTTRPEPVSDLAKHVQLHEAVHGSPAKPRPLVRHDVGLRLLVCVGCGRRQAWAVPRYCVNDLLRCYGCGQRELKATD